LIFRSPEFRLTIPFREITTLVDKNRQLRVGYAGDIAVFELGKHASTWATKIRNPRGLIDKLGVKAGHSVAVLGVQDEEFMAQLRQKTDLVTSRVGESETDFVFYEADRPENLGRLAELAASIKPNGAVWIVSPKGKGAQIKDVQVMAAAREAGLVDTKVVSFSDTHTALKLVIPVDKR
jgi:hypothetical protein